MLMICKWKLNTLGGLRAVALNQVCYIYLFFCFDMAQ